MWKNSIELYKYAIRNIRKAIEKKESVVKITLVNDFDGNEKTLSKVAKDLNIKILTARLRKRFSKYELKSKVKASFNNLVSFRDAPCEFSYSIIWQLELEKRPNIVMFSKDI